MLKSSAPFDQGLFLMHLHKGKEYFDQNELQKAREELEAAYHLRPQDEKVLNMLGMTYYKLEMLPQAEEMYMALSANNPDIYTLQSNLGLIRLKLDKLEQAKESLVRALELQPSNPKAHFYLGLLYEKQRNWEEALRHFQHANAEKMIAKMQEIIAEEKAKAEEILPFEVVEVLTEEVAETAAVGGEVAVAGVREEKLVEGRGWTIIQQAEPVVQEQSTEKIRSQDLAQAMERLHKEEQELFTEPAAEVSSAESEESYWNQDTERLKVQEVIESIQHHEVSSEEVELTEDSTPEVSGELEEGKVEEVKEESVQGEKTQPKLTIPETSEVETTQKVETESVAPAGSFFIAEEMAADISTFLAESREETEAVLTEEPPPVETFEQQELPEVEGAEEGELFETRIPTPAEIENATRDFGSEAIFEQPISGARETGEEGMELTEDTGGMVEEEEAEEEVVEEGHLEPSPMTPLMEEVAEMPFAEASPETISPEVIAAVEEQPFPTAEMPAAESREEIHVVVAPPEAYQPANLDQFSRDRFYVQPLIGADRFLLIDPHLLEIVLSEKLICRLGTISSYTGDLQFSPWQQEQKEKISFVQVSGTGVVFLADRRKEIFIVSLNQEMMFVEADHLLIAQSALKVEPYLLEHRGKRLGVSMVKVSGRGTVALTCQTKPLTLNVLDTMPVNIPADALIAWSGKLSSEVIEDEDLRKVMMASDEEAMFLRFSGNGDVVVEQGGLWGDRRAKK